MNKQSNDVLDPSDLGSAKRPKQKQLLIKGIPTNGLWGLGFLTVCASIMYANYRVFFGVNELVPRVMLIPSTLAVVIFFVYKSWK